MASSTSQQASIVRCRFAGDVDLLEDLLRDEMIASNLQDQRAVASRRGMRRDLLANAVRIDERTLPGLARTLDDVTLRAGLEQRLEAFVFADPAIQAFVVDGRTHMLIGLSSGAVETLGSEELSFVIGHELGHAVCGHVEYATGFAAEGSGLPPRAAMRVMAWSRACEITADRAGLICCGSVEVAANALFRSASGLRTAAPIQARALAAQWDHLREEVIQRGASDQWRNSHPYPPLRALALLAFADASGSTDSLAPQELRRVDQEVARMLAVMDPVAREDRDIGDPTLTELLVWSGLFVTQQERREREPDFTLLARIAPPETIAAALRGPHDPEACLTELRRALETRDRRLRSLESYRILEELTNLVADVAPPPDAAHRSIVQVAHELGLRADACLAILEKVLNTTEKTP